MRVFESNGPDVKIRGTASHVAEKYLQLARDAHTSGDPVASENYFQHAEHYFRLIAAAQEQFRQNNPYYQANRPEGGGPPEMRGEDDEEGEEEAMPQMGESSYSTREPQPYLPRDAQFGPPGEPSPGRPQQEQGQPNDDRNVERLPSFITGGQGQPSYGQPSHQQGNGGYDQNRQGDRFPLHRRRRRHRGHRGDLPGMQRTGHDSGGDAPPSAPSSGE